MLGYKIVIYSDSSYAIRCCTTYGAKCFKKNWTNPNNKNKPIPNLEIVKTAYLFCKDYSNIEFISQLKNKSYPSINNKIIFKHKDLYDLL